VAGAAGLWYWLNGKNTSVAVSSVADAEVTIDTTTVEPSTPAEADPSIFTRIGEWVVNAAATVKGWTVSAWTWVKGLFTRNTTSETTVDTTAETPVAA
jgi:hypothetical protein